MVFSSRSNFAGTGATSVTVLSSSGFGGRSNSDASSAARLGVGSASVATVWKSDTALVVHPPAGTYYNSRATSRPPSGLLVVSAVRLRHVGTASFAFTHDAVQPINNVAAGVCSDFALPRVNSPKTGAVSLTLLASSSATCSASTSSSLGMTVDRTVAVRIGGTAVSARDGSQDQASVVVCLVVALVEAM